jgi:hypothetical protein
MMRRAWTASILVMGMALAAPVAPLPAQAGASMEGEMVEVTVDLQDGFKDDTVVISAQGKELLRDEAVTTRFQIGKAKSLQLAMPAGEVTLNVEVPTKDARTTVPIDTSKPVFVGVSLTTEGRLEVKVQERPFGYM